MVLGESPQFIDKQTAEPDSGEVLRTHTKSKYINEIMIKGELDQAELYQKICMVKTKAFEDLKSIYKNT